MHVCGRTQRGGRHEKVSFGVFLRQPLELYDTSVSHIASSVPRSLVTIVTLLRTPSPPSVWRPQRAS
eukprot:scaffold207207_cov35-Tisochrysis_lutea.AAC.4